MLELNGAKMICATENTLRINDVSNGEIGFCSTDCQWWLSMNGYKNDAKFAIIMLPIVSDIRHAISVFFLTDGDNLLSDACSSNFKFTDYSAFLQLYDICWI